jgi:RNA methyltransferase, TrmH family
MISKTKTIVEPLPVKSFNKLTDTESSQGIVGVVSKPAQQKDDSSENLVIALDTVNDPGNLGTIIRTAYWFGVKTILLSKGSADPYNPKVIRSTQGGIFHTNIIEDVDLKGKLNEYKNAGYNIFLFTLNASSSLSQILRSDESDKSDKSKKSVIVFGSESHGISEELLNEDFTHVKIDGYSDCESLNVAMAAGIALYSFKKKYNLDF